MLDRTIKTYLQGRLPHYIDLLRKMVGINSFTANGSGVDALGELTAAAFAELGFQAEQIESANPSYGHHLVLTRRSPFGGRRVGLVSHLDTVFPPEEETGHDFHWREEGERIYGPGTVDVKGGTVLLYMVLDALRAVTPDAFDAATWVVLLDASEETMADDFHTLCRERLAPDALACLIFEGGHRVPAERGEAWTVVAARKGMATYRIRVEGKAAHAGSAHAEGANAIVQMADTILRVAALTDYERGLTFNVGRVSGGTVTNRVPHHAEAGGEMRAFSPQVFDEGVRALLALAEGPVMRSADGGFGCRVRVKITHQTPPWPRNPATERLVELWQAAGRSLGMEVVPEERGGLSDGNPLWDVVPTLDGLGPVGANAHCSERSADGSKEQEYVLSPSLVPKAVLDAMAILKLIEE
jgi:glutamate carboxypeptidase